MERERVHKKNIKKYGEAMNAAATAAITATTAQKEMGCYYDWRSNIPLGVCVVTIPPKSSAPAAATAVHAVGSRLLDPSVHAMQVTCLVKKLTRPSSLVLELDTWTAVRAG
jgi:hypothetical protein